MTSAEMIKKVFFPRKRKKVPFTSTSTIAWTKQATSTPLLLAKSVLVVRR